MTSVYRLAQYFALGNLLILLIIVPFPISFAGLHYGWQNAAFTAFLQVIVSLTLAYAAKEKIAGTDIAQRIFPAALVSYLLWSCMFLRSVVMAPGGVG